MARREVQVVTPGAAKIVVDLARSWYPLSTCHNGSATMAGKVIPDSHLDLFQKKAFGHLATSMPDGQPQVTPIWIDYDGRYVVLNTAAGRQKDKNLQRDGRVALSIIDPDNAYRYLEVRGHVAERILDGADKHIDAMAKKYLGQEKYPWRQPGEVRVIYKVEPDHTTSM